MSRTLVAALEARRLNVALTQRILRDEYPVGGPIRWMRGSRTCTGKVLRHHPNLDRVRVENDRTGAKYWITAPDICRALPSDLFPKTAKELS